MNTTEILPGIPEEVKAQLRQTLDDLVKGIRRPDKRRDKGTSLIVAPRPFLTPCPHFSYRGIARSVPMSLGTSSGGD
jgi:hypothetical protein